MDKEMDKNLKMNNSDLEKESVKVDVGVTKTKWDIRKMILIYIHEFFEVFVSILIIRLAMDKGVDMMKIVKASAVIGFLTFILENYNTDFNSNIKQGITFSVGSQMMSTFMN
jgi:hypothetical protein